MPSMSFIKYHKMSLRNYNLKKRLQNVNIILTRLQNVTIMIIDYKMKTREEVICLYNLSDLRKKHNMTQNELANRLNVSKSAVALWETGKRTPTLSKAIAIAAIFDVSVGEISFCRGNHEGG